ncbi:MAG TPA: AMP-binding protein [Candidatus Methylomirabilis sp.]|nr:AMP-binding protein [Candidatus Methylomirabilis sp.]
MSKPSYEDACRTFRWRDQLGALGWTADAPVNLGRTILDRHASSGRTALRWYGKSGERRVHSFAELSGLSGRFASWLRERGVREGDRVAGFLPRVPETLAIMVGAWRAGAVYVPIFTGFGPDAIEYRVRDSGAKVLCTHREHRGRVPTSLPRDAAVVTVGGDDRSPGEVSFASAIDGRPEASAAPRRREDPAVLLYTSGSTGPPKGVKIATNFVAAIHPYMVYGIDLRPDDVFWPTGDPGWGYGLVCYMVALAMGVAVTSHEASPSAEYCLGQLRDGGVTNLATTPTLLRSIMALGADRVRRCPVRVRAVSSCGEPLNAEVVSFFREQWGVTVMDQYGSSEFGMPVGNFNALAMAVKPGSMGRPLPGCSMAVVDDDGRPVDPDVVGHVAMRPDPDGYYSLGYWQDEKRTRELFRGGWMTIGDLARRDADGHFWFEGRSDDVIKSAGYRIGPFEVESAILGHPAVAEAAAVGKADALRGQIVKAFVVLKPGVTPYPGLESEIVEVVKSRVGRHQYPREIELVEQLPKTETGKIQRFALRARETA